MRWLPHYLDAFNAADNGETAREADRRAMYARPDALPLPAEPARLREPSRVSRLARSIARVLRPGRKSADSA